MIKKILKNLVEQRSLHISLKRETRKIQEEKRQKILAKYLLTKEQEKKIDALFFSNYGKKVSYDWHRYFASYTGHFDETFIPELIFIPIIEKKFNNSKYVSAFSDKNLLPLLINGMEQIRTPEIYLSSVNGVIRDKNCNLITKEQAVDILSNMQCFCKPTVDSNSGRACAVCKFENGVDTLSGKSAIDIIHAMGKDFCFQELVTNCDSVKKLHNNSLNTFRITTYLWDNKVCHFPVIMRIGQGGAVLDNAHQEGMFIALSDDGIMHECAFTEFQDRFYIHPDSSVVFKDYHVPETKMALEAVEKLHQRIPQLGMISWDVVVNDKNEVIIIEMNVAGQSVWLPQMAHGKGAFGENTADLLKWISK